jgi:hypothetical protein
MSRQGEKSADSDQDSRGARSSDVDPETGREKPKLRTEDMPSYTTQGRDELTGEGLAQSMPRYTPQGRTDSEEPGSADDQGRQGNTAPTGQGRMKPET